MANSEQLEARFRDLEKSGHLGHGYIFFGHGIGPVKSDAAWSLANFLENKKWDPPARILSDCFSADANLDGGINFIRSASDFLWQKPAISSRRTLIIDNAEALTLEAQNAVLKIAEEPPPSALLLMIARDPNVFLPALQSRFQKIFVADSGNPVAAAFTKEAEKFLKLLPVRKKEYLKDLVERSQGPAGEKLIENFVFGLIAELDKDPVKNSKILKELLHRWTLMNDFNVNKRLQLEAALMSSD